MIKLYEGPRREDDRGGDEDRGEDDIDRCPRCGRLLFDEMIRCPRCGYDSDVDEPRARQPWWVTLGALICLAMVAYWIMHP